jgi:NAD(P)-dependent dehydrogenase (short-subunit alcohol dehydrogenase family)
MELAGRVFAVTGAGNGMGREVTLELLRRGASVAGIDIKAEWLTETEKLAGSHSSNFSAHAIDITDRPTVAKLPAEIIKKHGQVDGLFNIAGIIQPFVRINDLDLPSADRVMNVNFFGPLNLVKALLPELLKRPQAALMNVSSMGSYAPVPGQTLYGASKAALNQLTEGLRSELKETGVQITLVYPGAIGTNIASNSGLKMEIPADQQPKMKVVLPTAAAKQMVDAVATGKKRIWIGQDANLMRRLVWLSTDFASNLIYKNMKSLLK